MKNDELTYSIIQTMSPRRCHPEPKSSPLCR